MLGYPSLSSIIAPETAKSSPSFKGRNSSSLHSFTPKIETIAGGSQIPNPLCGALSPKFNFARLRRLSPIERQDSIFCRIRHELYDTIIYVCSKADKEL